MKALTLHQPWASLVALGVKTIETRSWSTDYRGPLLIHAGAKPPKANVQVGEWRTMRWERGAAVSLCRQPSTTPIGEPFLLALPLGAIVASCTLADVVPIAHLSGYPPQPTLDVDFEALHLFTGGADGRGRLHSWSDVSSQSPYGDFTPGRFAWLLEDVEATTERCPAGCRPVALAGEDSGRYRIATDAATANTSWDSWIVCPTCDGKGSCDPIHAKGHQRLWEWTP